MMVSIKDLYRTLQVKEFDRIAIQDYKIAGFTLMQRAGKAALKVLLDSWPKTKKIVVVCGKGNNAGDGYVLARLAKKAKIEVTVLYLSPPEALTGDALIAYRACKTNKIVVKPFFGQTLGSAPTDLDRADVIIDAIFGSGLQGEVAGEYRAAIEEINKSGKSVLAIDIPSGLNADTGSPLGIAVKADITVTLVGAKRGMFTGLARDYCGAIIYDDLDLPAEIFAKTVGAGPSACPLNLNQLLKHLVKRHKTAYKNEFGHVLVIGGDHGMAGAVRMAGESAARVGAGLTTIATLPEHISAISGVRPELMCYGITYSSNKLTEIIKRATVLVIGPGLGRSGWSKDLWQVAIKSDKPLVVDADGLNWLAENPFKNDNWILTPHPGEAARLLACAVEDIQKDRFSAIFELKQRYGGTIVLKGAGTLVLGLSQKIGVCTAGNPGMASGGMGDVLSGIIGGLLAQGLSLENAAQLGVLLHSTAADLAANEYGERGLLATDLLPYLRRLVN